MKIKDVLSYIYVYRDFLCEEINDKKIDRTEDLEKIKILILKLEKLSKKAPYMKLNINEEDMMKNAL